MTYLFIEKEKRILKKLMNKTIVLQRCLAVLLEREQKKDLPKERK